MSILSIYLLDTDKLKFSNQQI